MPTKNSLKEFGNLGNSLVKNITFKVKTPKRRPGGSKRYWYKMRKNILRK